MKAVRFHGNRDIRYEQVPKPEPKPNEVLIEIEWCGLCGTDLTEYEHGPIVIPKPDSPHKLTGGHLPVTLGHEFSGRIVQPSPHSPLKVGDAVIIDPRINCTRCRPCISNLDHLCHDWGFVGLSGNSGGGGFSEFVAVEARMCHLLPPNVNFEAAALIEPLAVGRHAVNLLETTGDLEDKAVLVIGGGPIGLGVAWNLRAKGGKRVIVAEVEEGRRKIAKEVAGTVLDPREGMSGGLVSGMDALRVKGTYVNVAAWSAPMTVPFVHAMIKEATMKFSVAYTDDDYKAVVQDFIAGKFVGSEKMITSRVSLEDLPKAFEEIINNKDHHVKIIATPKGGKIAG